MDRPIGSSLRDPLSRGEDLLANLRLAATLAPNLCPGCAGYHVRVPAHRLIGALKSTSTDEAEIGRIIHDDLLKRMTLRPADEIRIVIPGSADTALLSIAAHAAALAGPDTLARCRFTVLDLCPTPLELCKAFADEHGLSLETAVVDLTAPESRFDADIIVLHSIFRFIPVALQAGVLKSIAGWLRPGGMLLFSNRLKSTDARDAAAEMDQRRSANDRVRTTLATAEGTADLDWGDLMPRLDRSLLDDQARPGEMATEDNLMTLLATSGLAVSSSETVTKAMTTGAAQWERKRVIVVLRR